MGDRSSSDVATHVSLWRAVGWLSLGGHQLWGDQSLWACITWVILGFSQVTGVTGMLLLSYREFKDRTGERIKEWEKDKKCEKRGYPSLSTEISLDPAFNNIAHVELTFILVNLGTLFKLGGSASRFHQIMKISPARHLFCSYSLISIQSDISFVWCCLL